MGTGRLIPEAAFGKLKQHVRVLKYEMHHRAKQNQGVLVKGGLHQVLIEVICFITYLQHS